MRDKRIYLSPPHLNGEELARVQEAFDSNFVAPAGPMLDEFEETFSSFTGIPYCLALSSATSALHLCLKHLGIKKNDIVLASTFTFIGSVSAAYHLGAKIVFIDSDPNTWVMSEEHLKTALEGLHKQKLKPKAIIPTDLYGNCINYYSILELANNYHIPVILDSAEATGSIHKGSHSGYDAYASVHSFNGNKLITTSGGGILASHDKNLINHSRKLAQQAKEPFPFYEHKEVGFNYRMSNICAAIGLGQMNDVEERVSRKRHINNRYRRALSDYPNISFIKETPETESNFWLTTFTVTSEETTPESLRIALELENIESRPVWKPMHLQPIFQDNLYFGERESDVIFKHGLCLPSGLGMTEDDIDRVLKIITHELKKN